jgi:hypothetical protein
MLQRISALACIAVMLSGCGDKIVGFPTVTTAYAMLQNVSVPGAGKSWSDGYGYADQADGVYLLTDRTNAGIDVVRMSNLQFLSIAGKGSFVGNRTTPAQSAGPNSVVAIGNGIVVGTDGNSDVIFVNVTTGATVTKVTIPNTGSTENRADLIGYDPTDNLVLVGNDVSKPSPVLTFISTVAPYSVRGQIVLSTATAGLEQPTYDPKQGVFLVDVPATTANLGGEVDVVSPTTMAITKVYRLSGNCGPTGSAIGPNEELGVSCGDTGAAAGSQIINATTGAGIASIPEANGCDEAWYNPGDSRFFFACANALKGTKPKPVVAVVDAGNGHLITTITTKAHANAVAVDPATDHVFIPERSGTEGINVYSYQ